MAGPPHPDAGPPAPTAGGFPPLAGPVDRESFFAAQERNRRATWRLSALCALAALLMGMPLSAVITPLLFGVAGLAADVANLVVPTPDLLRAGFEAVDAALAETAEVPPGTAALTAALLLAPGMLAMAGLWLGVVALFRRTGAGSAVLALGARPPRPGDLEERQIQNLAEEMAIAAGVRPPAVRLLDTPAANAAAIGAGPEEPVLVVSRGLLDRYDRDETQAVVAHLVAAAGNGDLGVSFTLLSLFQTLGLAASLLASPFGPEARGILRRLLGFALRRRRRDAAGEAREVGRLLAESLWLDRQGDLDRLAAETDAARSTPAKIREFVSTLVKLPFLIAYFAFWFTQLLFMAALLGPLLAFTWRSRRYLADATAVQLTRNPEALARALERLEREGERAAVAGGEGAAHLFVVWPPGRGAEPFWSRFGVGASFHPTVARRIGRLARLGANARPPRPRRWPADRREWRLLVLGVGLFLPLMLLVLHLAVMAAALLILVSLAIDLLFFFALVVAPLHWLLRELLPALWGG